MRILLAEDDPRLNDLLARALRERAFAVDVVTDGESALVEATVNEYDAIVLDVMLPRRTGLEVCAELRRRGRRTPILMLTARDAVRDRVAGLDSGADDYVVKPFSPRELAARVNGVLRRTSRRQAAALGPIVHGPLTVEPLSREVTLDGRLIEMTPKEFDVLAFLAASPRQVFSRAQLLESVWQSSPEWQDPATVTVHMRRIRNKIEDDPEHPRWITTVWGVGYRFEP